MRRNKRPILVLLALAVGVLLSGALSPSHERFAEAAAKPTVRTLSTTCVAYKQTLRSRCLFRVRRVEARERRRGRRGGVVKRRYSICERGVIAYARQLDGTQTSRWTFREVSTSRCRAAQSDPTSVGGVAPGTPGTPGSGPTPPPGGGPSPPVSQDPIYTGAGWGSPDPDDTTTGRPAAAPPVGSKVEGGRSAVRWDPFGCQSIPDGQQPYGPHDGDAGEGCPRFKQDGACEPNCQPRPPAQYRDTAITDRRGYIQSGSMRTRTRWIDDFTVIVEGRVTVSTNNPAIIFVGTSAGPFTTPPTTQYQHSIQFPFETAGTYTFDFTHTFRNPGPGIDLWTGGVSLSDNSGQPEMTAQIFHTRYAAN